MAFNEEETRVHLIDPVLCKKGYDDPQRIRLETPAPVEPTGPKGRRRRGPGRTDYLLCVQIANMPKPMPIAVLEAKREADDPLRGMQQAKAYAVEMARRWLVMCGRGMKSVEGKFMAEALIALWGAEVNDRAFEHAKSNGAFEREEVRRDLQAQVYAAGAA